MSYDPGPLPQVNFPPDTPGSLLVALRRHQENISAWCDRLRRGEGWDDLQASAIEGLATSALTTQEVPESSGALFRCFRHDQTDDLTFTKQFTHKWSGTVVHPHLHVMPLSAGSGNFAVSWKYAWLGVNAKLDGYTDMGEVILPLTAEDQYKHRIAPLGTLTPPAELGITSAFLIVFVERNRDGGDTYTTNKSYGTVQANVALLGMDTHHRQRIFGSEGEYR